MEFSTPPRGRSSLSDRPPSVVGTPGSVLGEEEVQELSEHLANVKLAAEERAFTLNSEIKALRQKLRLKEKESLQYRNMLYLASPDLLPPSQARQRKEQSEHSSEDLDNEEQQEEMLLLNGGYLDPDEIEEDEEDEVEFRGDGESNATDDPVAIAWEHGNRDFHEGNYEDGVRHYTTAARMLAANLASAEARASELEAELEETNAERLLFADRDKEAREQAKRLKQAIEEVVLERDQAIAERDQAKADASAMERMHEEASSQLQALQQQLSADRETQDTVDLLQMRIDEMTRELEEKDAQLQEQVTQIEASWSSRLDQAQQQLVATQQQLEQALQDASESASQQMQALSEQIEQLSSQNNQAETRIQELQAQLDTLTAENDQLSHDKLQLTSKTSDLQREIESLRQQLADQEKESKELQEMLARSSAAQESASSQVAQELFSLQQSYGEIMETNNQLQSAKETLEARCVELESNVQQLEVKIAEYDAERVSLEEKLVTKSEAETKHKQKMIKLESTVEEQKEKLARLLAKAKKSKTKADDAEMNLLRAEDEKNKLEKQVEDLNTRIDSLEEEKRSLEELLSYSSSQHQQQQLQHEPDVPDVAELQQEQERLEQRLQATREELSEARRSCLDAEREVSALEDQVQNYKTEVYHKEIRISELESETNRLNLRISALENDLNLARSSPVYEQPQASPPVSTSSPAPAQLFSSPERQASDAANYFDEVSDFTQELGSNQMDWGDLLAQRVGYGEDEDEQQQQRQEEQSGLQSPDTPNVPTDLFGSAPRDDSSVAAFDTPATPNQHEADSKLEALMGDNKALSDQLSAVQQELVALRTTCESMSADNVNLTEQSNHLSEELKAISAENVALREELEDEKRKVHETSAHDIGATQAHIAQLEQQIQTLLAENTSLRQDLDTERLRLEQVASQALRMAQLEEEVKHLETLNAENASLKQELESERQQVVRMADLEEEVKHLETLNAENASLKQELDAHKFRVTQLEQELESARQHTNASQVFDVAQTFTASPSPPVSQVHDNTTTTESTMTLEWDAVATPERNASARTSNNFENVASSFNHQTEENETAGFFSSWRDEDDTVNTIGTPESVFDMHNQQEDQGEPQPQAHMAQVSESSAPAFFGTWKEEDDQTNNSGVENSHQRILDLENKLRTSEQNLEKLHVSLKLKEDELVNLGRRLEELSQAPPPTMDSMQVNEMSAPSFFETFQDDDQNGNQPPHGWADQDRVVELENQNAELQDQVSQANSRIAALQEESDLKKREMESQQEEIRTLRLEIESLSASKSSAEEASETLTMSLKKLQDDIDQRIAAESELINEKQALIDKVKTLEGRLAELEELEFELKSFEEQIEVVDAEKKELQSTLDFRTEECDSFRQRNTELEETLQSTQHELKELQAKNVELHEVIQQVEASHTSDLERIQDLQEQLEAARSDLQSTEQRLQQAKDHLVSANQAKDETETALTSLQLNVQAKETAIRDLEDRLEQTEKDLYASERKVASLENKIEDLRADKQRATAELEDRLQSLQNTLVDKEDAQKKQLAESTSMLEKERGCITSLRADLEALAQEKESTETVLKGLMDDLKKENSELNSQVSSLKSTIELEKAAFRDLESKKAHLETQLACVVELKDSLEAKLKDTSEIDSMREQLSSRDLALAKLTARVQKLVAEKEKLELEKEKAVEEAAAMYHAGVSTELERGSSGLRQRSKSRSPGSRKTASPFLLRFKNDPGPETPEKNESTVSSGDEGSSDELRSKQGDGNEYTVFKDFDETFSFLDQTLNKAVGKALTPFESKLLVEQLIQEVNNCSELVSAAQQDRAKVQAQFEETRDDLESAQKELEQLSLSLAQSQAAHTTVESQVSVLEQEKARYLEQIRSLETQVNSLQINGSMSHEKEETNTPLEMDAQYNQLEMEKRDLESRCLALSNRVEELESASSNSTSVHDSHLTEEEVSRLKDALAKEQQTVADLQNQLAHLEMENTKASEGLERLRTVLEDEEPVVKNLEAPSFVTSDEDKKPATSSFATTEELSEEPDSEARTISEVFSQVQLCMSLVSQLEQDKSVVVQKAVMSSPSVLTASETESSAEFSKVCKERDDAIKEREELAKRLSRIEKQLAMRKSIFGAKPPLAPRGSDLLTSADSSPLKQLHSIPPVYGDSTPSPTRRLKLPSGALLKISSSTPSPLKDKEPVSASSSVASYSNLNDSTEPAIPDSPVVTPWSDKLWDNEEEEYDEDEEDELAETGDSRSSGGYAGQDYLPNPPPLQSPHDTSGVPYQEGFSPAYSDNDQATSESRSIGFSSGANSPAGVIGVISPGGSVGSSSGPLSSSTFGGSGLQSPGAWHNEADSFAPHQQEQQSSTPQQQQNKREHKEKKSPKSPNTAVRFMSQMFGIGKHRNLVEAGIKDDNSDFDETEENNEGVPNDVQPPSGMPDANDAGWGTAQRRVSDMSDPFKAAQEIRTRTSSNFSQKGEKPFPKRAYLPFDMNSQPSNIVSEPGTAPGFPPTSELPFSSPHPPQPLSSSSPVFEPISNPPVMPPPMELMNQQQQQQQPPTSPTRDSFSSSFGYNDDAAYASGQYDAMMYSSQPEEDMQHGTEEFFASGENQLSSSEMVFDELDTIDAPESTENVGPTSPLGSPEPPVLQWNTVVDAADRGAEDEGQQVNNEEFAAKMKEWQAEREELENKIRDLEEQLEMERSHRIWRERQFCVIESEREKALEESTELCTSLQSLMADLETSQKQLSQVQEERDMLQMTNNNLQASINSHTARIADLEHQLGSGSVETARVKEMKSTLERQLSEALEDVKRKTMTLVTLHAQLEEREQDYRYLLNNLSLSMYAKTTESPVSQLVASNSLPNVEVEKLKGTIMPVTPRGSKTVVFRKRSSLIVTVAGWTYHYVLPHTLLVLTTFLLSLGTPPDLVADLLQLGQIVPS